MHNAAGTQYAFVADGGRVRDKILHDQRAVGGGLALDKVLVLDPDRQSFQSPGALARSVFGFGLSCVCHGLVEVPIGECVNDRVDLFRALDQCFQ